MNKEHENSFGGVFPDEETFQKIYSECLENQPQAPSHILDNYHSMRQMFDEYLAALDEYMFRYAYQCGWETAKKGGATV